MSADNSKMVSELIKKMMEWKSDNENTTNNNDACAVRLIKIWQQMTQMISKFIIETCNKDQERYTNANFKNIKNTIRLFNKIKTEEKKGKSVSTGTQTDESAVNPAYIPPEKSSEDLMSFILGGYSETELENLVIDESSVSVNEVAKDKPKSKKSKKRKAVDEEASTSTETQEDVDEKPVIKRPKPADPKESRAKSIVKSFNQGERSWGIALAHSFSNYKAKDIKQFIYPGNGCQICCKSKKSINNLNGYVIACEKCDHGLSVCNKCSAQFFADLSLACKEKKKTKVYEIHCWGCKTAVKHELSDRDKFMIGFWKRVMTERSVMLTECTVGWLTKIADWLCDGDELTTEEKDSITKYVSGSVRKVASKKSKPSKKVVKSEEEVMKTDDKEEEEEEPVAMVVGDDEEEEEDDDKEEHVKETRTIEEPIKEPVKEGLEPVKEEPVIEEEKPNEDVSEDVKPDVVVEDVIEDVKSPVEDVKEDEEQKPEETEEKTQEEDKENEDKTEEKSLDEPVEMKEETNDSFISTDLASNPDFMGELSNDEMDSFLENFVS